MRLLYTTLIRWKSDYAAPTGRTGELFKYNLDEIQSHTDKLFYYLLLLQYPAAIITALLVTPQVCFVGADRLQFHVWLAIILGAILTVVPVYRIHVGAAPDLTRHLIAGSQMLMGALLVHLSGGRIETHFHIFGSLAFLAFYRDARILVTATVVVVLDHLLLGLVVPQSVYGMSGATGWRTVEHSLWIVFENIFLLLACAQSRNQLSDMASQQAQLEQLNGKIESAVRVRTKELSLRTEELAAARDAAMDSTRLKSQFLANVSHEIRTPMNGVLGMTSILLDTPLNREQRDCALTVQRSAEGLLTIINDILDFSKIEAGKLTLERIEFPLGREIEDAVRLVAESADRKQIELVCELHAELPYLVRGDGGRLRQVLVNLLANAIKFTEAGEVRITATAIRHEGTAARLRFEVADTGIGISESAGKRLFQSFVQVDGTTTRQYEGTGLGLAISKQLVELMDGQIGYNSISGKGTTFWFEIEVEVVTAEDRGGTMRWDALRGLRSLVVDDNVSSRENLLAMLENWGVSVRLAAGGREALDLLGQEHFDVALVDFRMPEMDGMEFARLVARTEQWQSMPLLMMHSLGERSVSQSDPELGIAGFVSKPVQRQRLFLAMSKACGRKATDDRHIAIPERVLEKSLSVLVAEDNLVNQRVLERMLERLGQHCDIVSNGEEAIAAVQKTNYDVVLMDCQMPRMDGYAATAAIRKLDGPASEVMIIAVTANAMSGARELCLAAGMNGHISKPIRLVELAEALGSVRVELSHIG